MPRTDDFLNAIDLAREKLASRDPIAISRNAGAEFIAQEGGKVLIVPYLISRVKLSYPNFRVEYEDGSKKLSLQEQGLILHYLLGAEDIPLTNELITFREIPSGEFYYQAFLNRAQVPLVDTFGSAHELFRKAGNELSGTDGGIGDVSLTFLPFPRIPITMVLWRGDDESHTGRQYSLRFQY